MLSRLLAACAEHAGLVEQLRIPVEQYIGARAGYEGVTRQLGSGTQN